MSNWLWRLFFPSNRIIIWFFGWSERKKRDNDEELYAADNDNDDRLYAVDNDNDDKLYAAE